MKKILALITLAITMSFAHGQTLPAEADQFIGTFFPDYNIQGIAEYAATSPVAFTVMLDNNVSIDFDTNGAWVGIKATEAGIPSAVVPTRIAQFVAEKGYTDLSTFATIEKKGETITLINQNGAGFVFDANGRFLRDTAH